ncbi:MAG: ABC transporter ATP-binding protein/permease [Lachnospiraceae bacterium]|nr:ABC transporter ATP-binding protein/permease [Lachnospiraceae bacterium]
MKHIFGNLWRHKVSVLLIMILLVAQAYFDLSLPTYTSEIVDVGLQQNGIKDNVPDQMRTETVEKLSLFMTKDDEQMFRDAYETDDEMVFCKKLDQTERKKLGDAISLPMVMMYSMNHANEATAQSEDAMPQLTTELPSLDQMLTLIEQGMADKEEIRSKLLKMEDAMLEKYGNVSDSIIDQIAVQFVAEEYEACGLNLHDIQLRYLWKTGLIMLLYSVGMLVTAVLCGLLSARTGATIGMELRSQVFHRVLGFSNTEMDRFSTASLITRSTNDIQQIQMVSIMLLRMVLYAPILGIGGVIKVLSTRTGMGWIVVAAVVSICAFVLILMAITLPRFQIMQKLVDRLNLVSREILTGLPVIRAFSREQFEEERFDTANQDLMKTQLFTNRVMTLMMPVMMLIMNGVSIAIVWFGGKGIDLGHLQVGDMIAFITYTMQIIMSFLMLTMISIMLPRAGVAADRIHEVVTTESTIADPKENLDDALSDCKGVVDFSDVSFCYDGASEPAIEHISFTAEPGKTTAIIGSTGCGKTTLINLIPRFYDVTSGQITIDGVDIRKLTCKKLRSLIGLVPQKGVLFSGDIESNLKFAGEFITDEQMKEAAGIAQAAEFIEQKEKQYHSEISQGGTNVSGGQKQRLSIARAIAKQPKVLIFDDSFSALDYKTDATLRKELARKTGDATVIIVAQRINTILHADQILVLEDGRIVGKGTHEQLLASCEAYQEIAGSQLSENELKGGAR